MASEITVLDDSQASKLFTMGSLEEVVTFYKAQGNSFQLSCANRNPLHYAAENKNPLVLLYLLKYQNLQQLINEKDDLDNRPLELATLKGYIKNIEILMFYGANEKLPLRFGHTIDGMLTTIHCIDNADTIVKKFIAKRECSGVLPEEGHLERELAKINAQLSIQNNKDQGNKTLINQLACSISHWLSSMHPSNSSYSTEKPAEKVPLIVKKTM